MTNGMESGEDLFKKGIEYHNKGDFDKAILFYKKSMETLGLDKKILVLLGNAYYETKKFKEAENAYKKALALDSNYSKAYFNLGILYEQTKKFDKAIEAYKKAAELDAGFAEAYANLGDLYREARDLDSAIIYYKKALEIDGGNQKAVEGLKYIPEYLMEKAEKRNLINKSDELVRKGISLEKKGEAEEAAKAYRGALRLYPESASALFLLALLSGSPQPKEELRFVKLKTSLICDSISPEVREYLGKKLGNIEFEPRVMESFFEACKTKVAQLEGDSVNLPEIARLIIFEEPRETLLKAVEIELRGDLEGAKKRYREVIEKAPYLTHAYYLFGLFLESSGNEEEALKLYRQASSHSFNYIDKALRAEIAGIFSAKPGYEHLGEMDVISILKEFHGLTDKDESVSLRRFIKYKLSLEAEAKIKYGFEKEESGASVEAISAYEDAISIDPSNPIAHYVLGLAYETRGLDGEAMAEYEKTKDADFTGLESSEDISRIIEEYLSKTTKDGHRVGTILSRYFEIIAKDPERMLELLGFIEDLNIDSISKIIKSYITTDMILGGKGKVVRDQLDFGGRGKLGIGGKGKGGMGAEGKVVRDSLDFGEHLDEEESKIEKAKSMSKLSFELLWKYKTRRSIRCEAIANDGRKILAGSENGIVYFIEQTAESPWRYESGSGIVDIDISPEGSFGVLCNSEGAVELLDCTQQGKPLWKKELGQGGVNSVAISSSADFIAAATNDFKIVFLDRAGEEKKTHALNQIITRLDMSEDGSVLIAASEHSLFLIKGERQPMKLEFKSGEHIQSIAFSKAAGLISVGTKEGSVYLLEGSGQVLWKNDLFNPVYGVAVSGDGKVAAGAMNGALVLYSRQGEQLWKYQTGENIWDVDISAGGERIIAGCGLVFGNIYLFSIGKEGVDAL